MKKFNKLMSLLLALAMLTTLTVAAFAAGEPTTYTITVNGPAGHTYEAYQIFTGDLSGEKLSNIVWGAGITDAGKAALAKEYQVSDPKDAASVAKALTSQNNASDFAAIAAANLAAVAGTSSENPEGTYTISGLNAGYYLLKDKDNSLNGQNSAYTNYILQVVDNVTVAPKASVPTVEKKVQDTDDTVSGWQDSADYDIGDQVPFQLKATLGDNLSGYTAYKLVFHDTLSAGLTFNADSMTVKVGETPLTADTEYTVNHANGALTVTINDVLAHGATTGTVVTVEYTATLNDNAVIGAAGNPNTVYLEYSNNPNAEGTGKTPEDKVTVFTYKLSIDKVDEKNEALKGAGFTLYKNDVAIGEEVKGADMTTFVWTGLDAGTYKLVETTVPAGYNKMADLEFTITATHEIESADPKLTDLTVNTESNLTADMTTGVISGTIVNQAGSTLPETGGIGTTVFYAAGSLLALTAVVLLITKKRMGSAN